MKVSEEPVILVLLHLSKTDQATQKQIREEMQIFSLQANYALEQCI